MNELTFILRYNKGLEATSTQPNNYVERPSPTDATAHDAAIGRRRPEPNGCHDGHESRDDGNASNASDAQWSQPIRHDANDG